MKYTLFIAASMSACIPPGPCFGPTPSDVQLRPVEGSRLVDDADWRADGTIDGETWTGPWRLEVLDASADVVWPRWYMEEYDDRTANLTFTVDPPSIPLTCDGNLAVGTFTLSVTGPGVATGARYRIGNSQRIVTYAESSRRGESIADRIPEVVARFADAP